MIIYYALIGFCITIGFYWEIQDAVAYILELSPSLVAHLKELAEYSFI